MACILRRADGTFDRVVEDRDCTSEQKKIRELNAGVYVFDCKKLFAALGQLNNNNAQGEYYLTDVPKLLQDAGGRVGVCAGMHCRGNAGGEHPGPASGSGGISERGAAGMKLILGLDAAPRPQS